MKPGLFLNTCLAVLLACASPGERQVEAGSATVTQPADSLVLVNAAGMEIWFTLARAATGSDGTRCVERGLEIRHGGQRIKVPLLYTGTPPVLINDSTLRAMLWTHCQSGAAYLVSLRSGQPVPERKVNQP